MSSTEEHHFLEGFEVNETEKEIHDLFIYLIFPLFDLLEEFFHVETLNSLTQSLWVLLIINYMRYVWFNDFVVLFEDVSVDKFVLFGSLEVHAVIVAEFLLNVLEILI